MNLDRVRRVAFSLRKLKSKMFEKVGGRDLLKYMCINFAISSYPDCCMVSRFVLFGNIAVFQLLSIN